MAATNDAVSLEKARETDCSFVWDDNSKLYFHASSGFYHDPTAGWYYSSKDGLYYTFENGSYVPMTSNKGEEPEPQQCTSLYSKESIEDKQGNEHFASGGLENQRPPSEWLEDTLIDLYLSGYSNLEVDAENSTFFQAHEDGQSQVSNEVVADQFASDELPAYHQVQQVEECMHEATQDSETVSEVSSEKGVSLDEERWLAQYGQVAQEENETMLHFPIVDLWDWEMVEESGRKRNKVSKLLGKLVRRSSKLHPSAGGLLRTASIQDVHLDLVRVASGKVYRLRIPNKRYLATLSTYDSTNPTKDWGFPDLFVNVHNTESVDFNQTCGFNTLDAVTRGSSSASLNVDPAIQKQSSIPYRDRAAERRNLHGEFSIGPGQKKFIGSNMFEEESTSDISDHEEAAAEAMNMTFGKGSYARKVLEKMGWKDGEALGSTSKGILEPLQAVGNKGYAGLGWNHIR